MKNQNNAHIAKYLRDAQSKVNQNMLGANGGRERHLGVDGFLDQDLYWKFTNDDGTFFNAEGNGNGGGNGAAAPMGVMPISEPYILTISNASAAQVSGFDIWLANIYLDNQFYNWSAGSITINGVTISSAMPAPINYWTMLGQSQQNPFTVGKTYLNVISGSNGQITQPLTLKTYDMSGKLAQKVISNPISPNQYQAGALENYTPYRIDGFTGISMTILASVVFQIYFYPANNINPSRGLAGAALGKQFANAPIGAAQKVLITNNG